MADDFVVIGVTLPDAKVNNEAARIIGMLESGVIDRMHLRKPESDISVLRKLLEAIPQELHSRLSLHDAPELISDFPDVGFNYNRRHSLGVEAKVLSCSCHSSEDVFRADSGLNYVMLSPVFDSISKRGYRGMTFDREKDTLESRIVIAMGGVVPSRFVELKKRGFSGAAMLGYLWDNNHDLGEMIEEIKINKCICCSL